MALSKEMCVDLSDLDPCTSLDYELFCAEKFKSAFRSPFWVMEHDNPFLLDLQIEQIERTLPIKDQVAFAFLAYPDPQEALHQIKNITEVHKDGGVWQNCVIGPWIRAQGPASWATAIDILHILQHDKLLETLGAGKIEQIDHVDKFRYSLFKVIDKLDNREIEILTQKMDRHASVFDYMEIKVLTWICEGKISLTNCQGFTSTLREIGSYRLCREAENLEETVRKLNEFIVPAQYENDAERSSNTLNAQPSLTTETYKIESYPFNPQTAGLCVIINQRNFQEKVSKEFADRDGTDKDRDALVKASELFGFKTELRENLSCIGINSFMKRIAKQDFRDSNALVVCLLSHGVKGAIIGTDGKKVNVNDLKSLVAKNKTLAGKPKLFFVQARQGDVGQRSVQHTNSDITTDGPTVSSPELSDFFEALATVPGFASYRSKQEGSFFIQTLCAVLRKWGHKLVIEDVLKKVNEIISYKEIPTAGSLVSMKQMPEYSSSLRRSLRFARHEDYC